MILRTVPHRLVLLMALIVVAFSACGADRPAVDDWQASWERISEAIPDEAALSATDSPQSICGETLVFLRANRADLLPTPDLAIDEVVTQWIEIAEYAFFECPPHSEQIEDFAKAYAEMSRLQAEIELVLDIDRAE